MHSLVLLSGPAAGEVVAGVTPIRLRQASARPLGEVLSLLYVPTGPSGTLYRYTLVYSSSVELTAAAAAANELDVPVIDRLPANLSADPARGFAAAVGVLYGTPRGHPEQKERLRLVEAALTRTINSADQPERRRWIAAMLAGWIQSDRFENRQEALAQFRAAQRLAEPASLEETEARLAQCRLQLQAGNADAARSGLRELIRTAGALRTTEVFERARRMLAGLEGGRR